MDTLRTLRFHMILMHDQQNPINTSNYVLHEPQPSCKFNMQKSMKLRCLKGTYSKENVFRNLVNAMERERMINGIIFFGRSGSHIQNCGAGFGYFGSIPAKFKITRKSLAIKLFVRNFFRVIQLILNLGVPWTRYMSARGFRRRNL